MKCFAVAVFVTVNCFLLLASASGQPAVERLERQLRDRQRVGDAQPDNAGYLGVVADDCAAGAPGVELMEVMAGSPATKGGLQSGDVVTKIADQPIRDLDDFAAALQDQPVGTILRFTIERKGEPKLVEVTLAARPPKPSRRFPNFGRVEDDAPTPPRMGVLGVRVEPVDAQSAEAAGSPASQGALVVSVAEDSPAARAGIPVQAVIVAVDGQEVRDPADLKQAIAASRAGQEVKVDFYNRGKLVEKRVRLAEIMPAQQAPDADFEPDQPQPPARPLTDKQRLDQLERRIQALEARLAELERVIAGN